jgi:uncharacterized protein (DUF1330 family)
MALCLVFLEMFMSKAYWIARVDVADEESYQGYVSGASPAFKEFGAKFLVRGGKFHAAEGAARARNVVIEFPSFQAAMDCYNSDIYQAAKSHRLPVSTAEIVIVEGVENQDAS